MATNWPTSRDTFTNPTSGDTLDSPSHAAQHANINDAVEAMQAHAGLVLVKPSGATGGTVGAYGAVTIGSGVSSVTVNDAFSSTYDNYRIVIYVDEASSSAAGLRIQFGSVTTGYYGSIYYDIFSGASGTVRTSNGANLDIGLLEASNRTFTSFDVGSPYLTEHVMIHGTWTGRGAQGWQGGKLANTASQTDFTILPSTGTMTGGTIRVYGYNNG